MCAPLHVSSRAESVRSVPVHNLSMLWISILERCQEFQLLKTIWGLLLLTTSTLPLLHPFLQGCNLTHPHVHHVLGKVTQKMRGCERAVKESVWWMDTAPRLHIKQSIFHRNGMLRIHCVLLFSVSKCLDYRRKTIIMWNEAVVSDSVKAVNYKKSF